MMFESPHTTFEKCLVPLLVSILCMKRVDLQIFHQACSNKINGGEQLKFCFLVSNCNYINACDVYSANQV